MSDSKTHDSGSCEPENEHEPDLHRPEVHALLEGYWRRNVIYSLILLAVWAGVGLGCGILFADKLNQHLLPGTGFPLGFWFAQQGSIIAFVVIILIYCLLMNRLDDKHHKQLEELNEANGDGE